MKQLTPFGAFAFAMAAVSALALGSQACGGDENLPIGDDSGGRRNNGTSSGGNGETLPQGLTACVATCTQDDECSGCADNKTRCDVSAGKCIECGPNAGGRTCAGDKQCSQAGFCNPRDLKCPTDANDVPTIECNDDAACGACAAEYRVCNPATKKCGACNPAVEVAPGSLCQTTEACNAEGQCEPRCPVGCKVDGDCGKCGDKGGPAANFCTRGECSQCNRLRDNCAAGTQCADNGTCVTKCGDNTNTPLECESDNDCRGCKDVVLEDNGAGDAPDAAGGGAQGVTSPASWSCKKIGSASKGKCAPDTGSGEEGCRKLGSQLLPSPFNKVTTLCSSDEGCANTGVSFNVGGLLSKLTELPGINQETMLYPMKKCAKMEILGNDLPCGICVPCAEDSDCKDINIIESVGSVFGPVGSLLSRVLSSTIFGDNPPIIYMTCNKVFGNFGACVPCSSLLTACGDKVRAPATEDAGGEPKNDQCAQRARGWYCSGEERRVGFFCNGNGENTQGLLAFCDAGTPNCLSVDSSSAKAKTTAGNDDPSAQDSLLPECSASPDPNFPSRQFGADAGAGAPQGIRP